MKLPEYKRRSVIPLIGLALAAYYSFVFVPLLVNPNRDLDVPLQQAWKTLASSLEQTNATALDFQQITNQLNQTRQALTLLRAARKRAFARIEVGDRLRAKMSAPFELLEYESERERKSIKLGKLTKQQQVTIEPTVFYRLPKQTADVRQPTLL